MSPTDGIERYGTERRALWLANLERWTEWPLTLLALVLIPLLLLPYLFPLSDRAEAILVGIDYLIWGVFAADLAVKVAIAPDRRRYLRRHWLDVVLVALPMLRPVRAVRSLRTLRALHAGRAGVAAGRALVGVRRGLTRRGVRYTLVVAGVIVAAVRLRCG